MTWTYYALPVSNQTGLDSTLVYLNSVTNGIFVLAMILLIFGVLILSMRRYNFEITLMVSSFITTLITFLFSLVYVGAVPLIDSKFVFLPLVIFIGATIWSYFRGE